jgi:hypothetical protein
VWGGKAGLTAAAYELVCAINDILQAMGKASSDRKAVDRAIDQLQSVEERYRKRKHATLRRTYFRYKDAGPPAPGAHPIDLRNQQVVLLQKWGESPDGSYALADRLIALCTVKHRHLGLDYIGEMFKHVTQVRRLRKPQSKVEWLKHAADQLDNPRPFYPIRPWDMGSNANMEAVSGALHDGLSGVGEIAGRTGIKLRTTQELLAFMASPGVGKAVRLKHGRYGPPQEGAANYVRSGEAVLKVLERGPASREEIRIRANLTEGQATGAIHWLWRRANKIVRPEPNLYSLPAPGLKDHVYAYEAFMSALLSGKKCMPEVEEITGKTRPELWAAFRSHLRPDDLVKHVGFRSGPAVRPGFRGRVAVFELTAKGRKLTHQSA